MTSVVGAGGIRGDEAAGRVGFEGVDAGPRRRRETLVGVGGVEFGLGGVGVKAKARANEDGMWRAALPPVLRFFRGGTRGGGGPSFPSPPGAVSSSL